MPLENFCDNRNGEANQARNNKNKGFRSSDGNFSCQVFDNAHIDLTGNEKGAQNHNRDTYIP